MDLAELRTVHKREMEGWGGACRMITGPLYNATCTTRKLVSEPCWQSDYTAKQNLFFITLYLCLYNWNVISGHKTGIIWFFEKSSPGIWRVDVWWCWILYILSLWYLPLPTSSLLSHSFSSNICGTESVYYGLVLQFVPTYVCAVLMGIT